MRSSDAWIDELNRSGKRLSKSHRRIAQYIMESHDRAANLTAGRLAESVGVSESTVVRFAVALGYAGYPQFQRALKELIRHHLTSVQRIGLTVDVSQEDVLKRVLGTDIANIRATLGELSNESFSRTIDILGGAKHIYVLGQRASMLLSTQLAYYLDIMLENVHRVGAGMADVFDDLIRVEEGDALVAISFPRYSRKTMEAIRFAKHRGAKVIGLTDGPLSPLADISDELLIARGDMASFADSLVAPMAVINAIIVALSLRNQEKLSERLNAMEQIWADHSIYLGEERG